MPQSILMCPPDFFGVDYVINPWMEGNAHRVDNARARDQWSRLRDALAARARILLMPPVQGLPDLVFTANAGLVGDGKVVVSRMRTPERQPEEKHFRAWFESQGMPRLPWPSGVSFEGAGDALWDRDGRGLWLGSGFRSSVQAGELLARAFRHEVLPLSLVDPSFYHLDTCFCPLEGGWVMYYPPAFAPESQALIEARVPATKRIIVEKEDASGFACNAVDLDGEVFLNHASQDLQAQLKEAGFQARVLDLSEFLKAGGAAKCLTLKLVEAVSPTAERTP